MKVIKIEGSPKEVAEFFAAEEEKKPVFVSDVDIMSLKGALKDFSKNEKESVTPKGESTKTTEKVKPSTEDDLSQKMRAEFASNAKINSLVGRTVREMERTEFTASEALDFLDRLKNSINYRTNKKEKDDLF